MRYLITHPDHKPFLCDEFTPKVDWMEGMTVFDMVRCKFTIDGKAWEDIIIDSL